MIAFAVTLPLSLPGGGGGGGTFPTVKLPLICAACGSHTELVRAVGERDRPGDGDLRLDLGGHVHAGP